MKDKKDVRRYALALVLTAAIGVASLVAHGALGATEPVAMKDGVSVLSNSKAAVDISNLAEGYVMIRYTGGKDIRVKTQISRGSTVYTYNLNNKGTNETFPLTEGNGNYTIKVFENTAGSKYAQAYSTSVDLQLRNEFAPFLYANQYVSFDKNSKSTAKAAELTKGKTGDLEKITAVYEYVVKNTSYDYAFAKTVQPGYIPNVDQTLQSRKGICFDYAALMAAMLRSQNIPTKLLIGYTGDIYHAWLNVYIEGQGWVQQAIYFDGKSWTLMDPTFASTGKSSDSTMKYITNKANYSMKYAY